MKTSKMDYFLSLAEELNSQASRVRQLIGSAHWGQDGRHKEALLRELIRRHSPASVLVTSGFLVSPNNVEVRSLEQDILLIDTSTEAPLFNQADLAIVFPHTVIAAISVKSTMRGDTVKSVVDGLKTVRDVARDAATEPNRIWCGGLFYTVQKSWLSNPAAIYASLKKHVLANPAPKPILDAGHPHVAGPDVLVDAGDMAFLFDYEPAESTSTAKIRGYACKGAATAIFLSCMLEHMALRLTGTRSVFSDFLSELDIPRLEPPVISFAL